MTDSQSESGKQEEREVGLEKGGAWGSITPELLAWRWIYGSPLGFRGWGCRWEWEVRGHRAEGWGHSCRIWAWIWQEPAGSLTSRMSPQQERISYWTAFWPDSISKDLMSSRRVVWTFHFLNNKTLSFWWHSLEFTFITTKETNNVNDGVQNSKIKHWTVCFHSGISSFIVYWLYGL